MSLLIEVVTEESFYENLTLGLTETLVNSVDIRDVRLENRMPCERMQISSWEQRNCCQLPEDLKKFYLSTDGFKLTWNYDYAGEIIPIGNMHINRMTEVRRIGGAKQDSKTDFPSLLDVDLCNQSLNNKPNAKHPEPSFGPQNKIFELNSNHNVGKVCLVYQNNDATGDANKENQKIWLLDRSYEWHFLAESFTQYFKMMLVHLGLPQWPFLFTDMGLTPWAEHIFSLIAPHLLNKDIRPAQNVDWNEVAFNHLDPSVFKNRTKQIKKKSDSSKLNISSK